MYMRALVILPLLCSAYPPSIPPVQASGRKGGPSSLVPAAAALGDKYNKDPDAAAIDGVVNVELKGCPSNSTHIGWPSDDDDGAGDCTYQKWSDAKADCVRFLRDNLMPFDVPNAGTLGFPTSSGSSETTSESGTTAGSVVAGGDSNAAALGPVRTGRRLEAKARRSAPPPQPADPLPDGLSDGIVNQTIHLALATKVRYPWTARIPRSIFNDYVLNFASANEARTNWRPLLTDAIRPTIERLQADNSAAAASRSSGTIRIEDVVKAVNQDLWKALGRYDPATNETKPIYFKTGQTPLIFDPMSVIAFGYASCTGMAILFVHALRAAGVPARLAGTPAWNGDLEKGNHNWVEVWTPLDDDDDGGDGGGSSKSGGDDCDRCCRGRWRFLEPSCGDFGDDADNLDRDPCRRWFCRPDRFDGTTRVYAARYDRVGSGGVVYPLAWDLGNWDVPGVDRTEYYTEIARRCS